ncbi:unnamed protein product [Protopolystoma xenopodis]|uniref:Mitochondrial chaperone BCS1-like ATPase lid domain-containing protein n=1 Tax=Protopolystoma xenopodis TaxID=117903 RepID=A0A3S5APR6_9PLAT|nr:unnamed protein product [Protopolystoma xenopodis]
MRVEFGLCTHDQIARLFSHFYPIRVHKTSIEASQPAPLHPLAWNFSLKIPPNSVSSAQIQGFLLMHKDDSEGALHDVAHFVEELSHKPVSLTQ